MMGPATEEALRPEANERKRKKNRRRRTAPVRLNDNVGRPEPPDTTGRRMPTVRAPPSAAAACGALSRARAARSAERARRG